MQQLPCIEIASEFPRKFGAPRRHPVGSDSREWREGQKKW